MASGIRVRWIPHVASTLDGLPKVGEMTSSLAERCKGVADSGLSEGGYRYEGHEVVALDMNGYVVRTKTDQARHSQNQRKTLTKAFQSLRG